MNDTSTAPQPTTIEATASDWTKVLDFLSDPTADGAHARGALARELEIAGVDPAIGFKVARELLRIRRHDLRGVAELVGFPLERREDLLVERARIDQRLRELVGDAG